MQLRSLRDTWRLGPSRPKPIATSYFDFIRILRRITSRKRRSLARLIAAVKYNKAVLRLWTSCDLQRTHEDNENVWQAKKITVVTRKSLRDYVLDCRKVFIEVDRLKMVRWCGRFVTNIKFWKIYSFWYRFNCQWYDIWLLYYISLTIR